MNDTAFSGRRNKIIYAAAAAVLLAGVAVGSVCLAKCSGESAENIRAFISGKLSSIAENKNSAAVFKNSLKSNLVTLGIIFVMGFFRFGFIGTGAVIARKGFVMGFTAASFYRLYGARGILIMLTTMPTAVITIPALLFYGAVSVKFSLTESKKEKKLIFSYIFLLFLMITIFCAASLSEGYLTTTFMKIISPKFT